MLLYGRDEEFNILRKRQKNSPVFYIKAGETIYAHPKVGSAIRKDYYGVNYIETANGTKIVSSGKMLKLTPSSYTPSGYEAEIIGEAKDFINIDGVYYHKRELKKAALVIPNRLPSFLKDKEKDYMFFQFDEGYRVKNSWGEKAAQYGCVWVELNSDPDILGVDVIKPNSFRNWVAVDEKCYHLSLKELINYEY